MFRSVVIVATLPVAGLLAMDPLTPERPTPDKRAVEMRVASIREAGIDLFLERCYAGKEKPTLETFAALHEFARELHTRAEKIAPFKLRAWPVGELLSYPVHEGRTFEYGRPTRKLVLAEEVRGADIVSSICVLRSGIRNGSANTAGGSLFFLGGDTSSNMIYSSVVLVEGTIDCSVCGSCLVIASGDVTVRTISGCVIVTKGRIDAQSIHSSLICAHKGIALNAELDKYSKQLPREQDPFADIKFFSTADIGLDVKQAKTELHITGVKNQSPFGKAGMEPGDVIAAANGKPLTEYEPFRRIIRRAYAEEATVLLSIRRQGKPINVKVEFKEQSK
jgi:hypothetical protein